MMVSFVLSFFPRDVLDEILNLIESVSEDFPSYSLILLGIFVIFFLNSKHSVKILSVCLISILGNRVGLIPPNYNHNLEMIDDDKIE